MSDVREILNDNNEPNCLNGDYCRFCKNAYAIKDSNFRIGCKLKIKCKNFQERKGNAND